MSELLKKEKCTVKLGNIRFGSKTKCHPARLYVELRTYRSNDESFTFDELSICGEVATRSGTLLTAGQCLDHMVPDLKNNRKFIELYRLWQRYHLNDMHPGTPEQENALKEAGIGRADYDRASEYLRSKGLFEVPLTGATINRKYNGEPFSYGSGWVINFLPEEVENRIREIIKENSTQR